MLRARTGILAENVAVDRESGQTFVFNLIDNIASVQFPVFVRQVVFIALIERDAADPPDYNFDFSVELNGVAIMGQQGQPVSFDPAGTAARAMITIKGLVIPGPGRMALSLRNGPAIIAEYSVGVIALPAPAPAQANPAGLPPPVPPLVVG
jgi:hypothetical protein